MKRKTKNQFSEEMKILCTFFEELNELIEFQQLDNTYSITKRVFELQHKQKSISKNSDDNRIVPLNILNQSEFELTNKANLSNPQIIYGPSSDEMLRSNGLLAMAIANKIYIQTRNYKPETEEGRAILNHELTHVQQYSEKRLENNIDKENLELEAESNEFKAYYKDNPIVTINIMGIPFKIQKSRIKSLKDKLMTEIENKIEQEIDRLPAEKQYELLLHYEFLEKKAFLDNPKFEF